MALLHGSTRWRDIGLPSTTLPGWSRDTGATRPGRRNGRFIATACQACASAAASQATELIGGAKARIFGLDARWPTR